LKEKLAADPDFLFWIITEKVQEAGVHSSESIHRPSVGPIFFPPVFLFRRSKPLEKGQINTAESRSEKGKVDDE
jgi:hypothetical protein